MQNSIQTILIPWTFFFCGHWWLNQCLEGGLKAEENNKLKYICWNLLIQRAFADSDIDAAGFILKVMERWHLFICRLCLICLAYILWHVRATPAIVIEHYQGKVGISMEPSATVRQRLTVQGASNIIIIQVQRGHSQQAPPGSSTVPSSGHMRQSRRCNPSSTFFSFLFFFLFFFVCVQLKPGLVLSPYQSSPRTRPAL